MKYHFGLICPPFTGHLNPLISLSLELQSRQHKITLFHYNTNEDKKIALINQLGINTIFIGSYGSEKFITSKLKDLSKLKGWKANDNTVKIYTKLAKINLDCLSEIKAAGCQALLIDQTMFEGETIASSLNVPFITICSALMLNPDRKIPPSLMQWQPDSSFYGIFRNLCGYLFIGLRFGKTIALITKYRKQKSFPVYPSFFKGFFDKLWSSRATITQQFREFEFDRSHSLPKTFHFTAPFINFRLTENINFPWEKLDGRPLIYASLGTLQNSADDIYHKIAQACKDLDYQLVMSYGKSVNNELKTNYFPKNAITVPYAPQIELLKKASLCITHAGINTVLESLFYGVPIVAIPIANDQPGVAARVEWTKTGKAVSYRCKTFQLRKIIEEVLSNPLYRANASNLKDIMQKADGVKLAADIIERVL